MLTYAGRSPVLGSRLTDRIQPPNRWEWDGDCVLEIHILTATSRSVLTAQY